MIDRRCDYPECLLDDDQCVSRTVSGAGRCPYVVREEALKELAPDRYSEVDF